MTRAGPAGAGAKSSGRRWLQLRRPPRSSCLSSPPPHNHKHPILTPSCRVGRPAAGKTTDERAQLLPLLLRQRQRACPRALCARAAAPGNVLPLALFLLHYAYRDLVYPLRLRGGKPTPAAVWAMALVFCLWNGYLQVWVWVCVCVGGG